MSKFLKCSIKKQKKIFCYALFSKIPAWLRLTFYYHLFPVLTDRKKYTSQLSLIQQEIGEVGSQRKKNFFLACVMNILSIHPMSDQVITNNNKIEEQTTYLAKTCPSCFPIYCGDYSESTLRKREMITAQCRKLSSSSSTASSSFSSSPCSLPTFLFPWFFSQGTRRNKKRGNSRFNLYICTIAIVYCVIIIISVYTIHMEKRDRYGKFSNKILEDVCARAPL